MYIKRDLEDKIISRLNDKEIIAILGPRQAGKTTMINNILNNLNDKKINRLSFDDIEILESFEKDIKNFIKSEIENYDIVFIDEVQYSKESGKKLKFIYDNYNIKIIISGSSASELSLQSLKYLVGRIFIYELFTFSFDEFLRYKNEKLYYIYLSGKYGDVYLNQINDYLFEYESYGGYPRVLLQKTDEEKKEVLKNIYNVYILREIKEIIDIKDNFKLNNLMKILSLNIGNVINYSDISSNLSIDVNELKELLTILEKTYIIKLIQPFYTNKIKEIIKSPKCYFFDLGFRNIILSSFDIKNRSDYGSLNENFIFANLIRKNYEVKYWRTKTKAEVDFILEKDSDLIPIEVKTSLNNNVLGKGYISFLDEYKTSQNYILSLNYFDFRIYNQFEIKFLPFVKFLIEVN